MEEIVTIKVVVENEKIKVNIDFPKELLPEQTRSILRLVASALEQTAEKAH